MIINLWTSLSIHSPDEYMITIGKVFWVRMQVTLRPPWGHMGARASTFGLAERWQINARLIIQTWWVQVYTGGFEAGLPHGPATLEIPGGWRSTLKTVAKCDWFTDLQIWGPVCGRENARWGHLHMAGWNQLSRAIQQWADDWGGEVS